MAFTLTVTNDWVNYILFGDDTDSDPVAPGTSQTITVLGVAFFSGGGIDTVTVLDIGTDHIGGDSGEANGALIPFRGINVVGRYDGTGALTVTINKYGQVSLDGMDFRQVSLRALTFNQTARKKKPKTKTAARPAKKAKRKARR